MKWRMRRLTLVVALVIASLAAGCGDACDDHVDYTIPKPQRVLKPAEALVEASVTDISRIGDYRIEVRLDVSKVLLAGSEPSGTTLGTGALVVQASDDPCARRSGLVLAGDATVLVVLSPSGEDAGVLWSAWPTLREEADGSLEFLDDWAMLNERMEEILRNPTVEGLVDAIER